MRIDPMIFWLDLWETIPALAQMGIAFIVAWAMLTVLDWILEELPKILRAIDEVFFKGR